MKAWPSTIFTAAALMILPLAVTACDRKAETKETKIIKEEAPAAAPAPIHETTIINERSPAPVVHDTTIHDTTVIKENDRDHRDDNHDHDNH